MIPDHIRQIYPFRSQYVALSDTDDLRMHYIDEGAESSDALPLLCVHGNPTWSFYFRNIISHFKKSRRVIAPDHIGCGASSAPQDFSYTLERHIENLGRFIEKKNLKKVDLLVHDWGGAIALGWAVKNPEKVGRIILTNTAGFRSKNIPYRIAIGKIPVVGEFMIRRFNAFARAAIYMAPAKPLNKNVRKGLLWPYRDYRRRIAVARFVQDIPLHSKHQSYDTLHEIEKGLQQFSSALILWGEKDFCFNQSFLDKWKEIWPDSKIISFSEGGHYLLEDESQACIRAIEEYLH